MHKTCIITVNDASSNIPLIYSYGTYSVPSVFFFCRWDCTSFFLAQSIMNSEATDCHIFGTIPLQFVFGRSSAVWDRLSKNRSLSLWTNLVVLSGLLIWAYSIAFVRFESGHASETPPLYAARMSFWDLLRRFVTSRRSSFPRSVFFFPIVLSRARYTVVLVIMPRFARIALSQAPQGIWHHGIYPYILYVAFYV